jgi:hypothetical protein
MSPIDDLLYSYGVHGDDGTALMTELVAAVRWLRRGAMPCLTIWDAIDQALRWQSQTSADWNEPDPLRTALQIAIADTRRPLAHMLEAALRAWLAATSQSFNGSVAW